MQVHEVTQMVLGEGILDKVKDYLDPVGRAEQIRARDIQQGMQYKTQALAKLDAITQQKSQAMAAEWLKTPGSLAATTQPATKPTAGTVQPKPEVQAGSQATGQPAVSFAGQRQRPLDPKNPSDAKILAQLQSQGKLQEDPQADNEYRSRFIQWANDKLASRESTRGIAIDLNTVMKSPEYRSQLDSALNDIEKNSSNALRLQPAVANFLNLAMKAMQDTASKIRQGSATKTTARQTGYQSGPDPVTVSQGQTLASDLKLDLEQFRRAIGIDPVKPTGNRKVDALLIAAGVLK